jgi:hypothetical protein
MIGLIMFPFPKQIRAVFFSQWLDEVRVKALVNLPTACSVWDCPGFCLGVAIISSRVERFTGQMFKFPIQKA